MRRFFVGAVAVVTLLIILSGVVWFLPMVTFPHDKPRDVPWPLADVSKSKHHIEILDDGRIRIEIEHLPLVGIRPEMVAWFYKKLPISTVTLNGNKYPLYHLFHQSEHGRIAVIESSSDGTEGMGVGALVQRQEWFGNYNSKGAGRIIEFSDQGMTVKPEKFGLHFGSIRHQYRATDYGTAYTLVSELGSTTPIIGPIINAFIRHKMMPKAMLEQWVRHQIEEVYNLNHFLLQIYQPNAKQNHFEVSVNSHG